MTIIKAFFSPIPIQLVHSIHVCPHDNEPCVLCVATSSLLCRVLDAVDAADHLLLLLRFPPPPHQAEDTAGAETEGDQSDRLQRGLHLPILHAGPQYVCSNSLSVSAANARLALGKFFSWGSRRTSLAPVVQFI